ncbi:MAG: bifunctional riboflavin kinase/FAD synthetase [Lachnospiraceae bacterium]|nr:bifunctional riboflavin kinase/FAD synthetase [Lachnospiraceae bacterium]
MIKDGVRTAVAIGKFDGMHLGHMKLLQETASYRDKGYSSLVFTFESPVADFFTGERSRVLTPNSEKERLLLEAGIDYLYMMPVNRQTVSCDPEAFVREILVGRLKAGVIAAGSDLSFGDRGAGDMALLKRLSAGYGGDLDYEVSEIEKVRYRGEAISSSLIRDAVASGDMERAADMLGRPYLIEGRVVHGRKLGKSIGMPTANQIPADDKLVPPYGVYASEVEMDGRLCRGITNIGMKPTVKDDDAVTAETHIFDFDRDIYGENIRVGLLRFIRPEMKFESLAALKAQMEKDMMEA